jgi:hypothetical protein
MNTGLSGGVERKRPLGELRADGSKSNSMFEMNVIDCHALDSMLFRMGKISGICKQGKDGFDGLVVSILATGTRVRGLDFSGIQKILSMPSFGREVK